MTVQQLYELMEDVFSTSADYPFSSDPDTAVFRHVSNRKWFAVFMPGLKRAVLGLTGEERADVLNLKCGALLTGSLINGRSILPAYHMNKEHWISVLIDGNTDAEALAGLIEISYDLTK